MGMKDMDPDCVGPFGPCKIVEQADRGSGSHGIHCVGPSGPEQPRMHVLRPEQLVGQWPRGFLP